MHCRNRETARPAWEMHLPGHLQAGACEPANPGRRAVRLSCLMRHHQARGAVGRRRGVSSRRSLCSWACTGPCKRQAEGGVQACVLRTASFLTWAPCCAVLLGPPSPRGGAEQGGGRSRPQRRQATSCYPGKSFVTRGPHLPVSGCPTAAGHCKALDGSGLLCVHTQHAAEEKGPAAGLPPQGRPPGSISHDLGAPWRPPGSRCCTHLLW